MSMFFASFVPVDQRKLTGSDMAIALLLMVVVWPAIIGPLVGSSAWVTLSIKQHFPPTTLEFFQDDEETD
jgi:hypothetical protein